MHPMKFLVFLLFVLVACSPASIPTEVAEVQSAPIEILATATTENVESPTPTPEQVKDESFFPYYLPRAIRPEVEPQTINAVTAKVDWAYADESRIALQYTISGLDWPDGTDWNAMDVQFNSPSLPDTAYSGAEGGTTTVVQSGVITGTADKMLLDGALNAEEVPNINLKLEIPLDGLTSIGTFNFQFPVPVVNGIKIEDIDQTVVTNDVSMTLQTLIFNPSHVEALICFQMPSAVDWGLTASAVTIGDREFPFSGGGLLPGIDGKGIAVTDPDRCNTVGFDVFYDNLPTSITLTVPKLLGSIPEVIDDERVAIANERLASVGIEIDYENIDHGGNLVVLKQPEGVPDHEIYPLIWDALAEQHEGPWSFTVKIPQ
ncbi:MAG TPA: hypothetical protein VK897_28150 [Anaerolineales bacterium]|nr:hypothetical protein [Anaerolineales bacterium]